MYLFSRRARLALGHGMAGVEWAQAVCAKVNEVTGHEVQLWATVYSPGFGTVSWTSWVADLTTLESIGDKLAVDTAYTDLVNAGAQFLDGGIDDSVLQVLAGQPDPSRDVQYVTGAQAVVADGQIERAMGAGIEIGNAGESITGIPTLFVRSLTGPYGQVGWLTGFVSLAEMEAANDKLAADPSWLKTIDGMQGCFLADVNATQSTMYRRLA